MKLFSSITRALSLFVFGCFYAEQFSFLKEALGGGCLVLYMAFVSVLVLPLAQSRDFASTHWIGVAGAVSMLVPLVIIVGTCLIANQTV